MTDPRPDSGARLAAYQDDDFLVICSRRNPNAWIRSDTTVSLPDVESDTRALAH